MDSGANPIGGTELRHPHEHVDAKLLRPGQVDLDQVRVEERDARPVAMQDGEKYQKRPSRHQRCDQYFLEPIEEVQHNAQRAPPLSAASLVRSPLSSLVPPAGRSIFPSAPAANGKVTARRCS